MLRKGQILEDLLWNSNPICLAVKNGILNQYWVKFNFSKCCRWLPWKGGWTKRSPEVFSSLNNSVILWVCLSVTQNHSLTIWKGLGTAKIWLLLEKGTDKSLPRGFLCPHQSEKEHLKAGLDEGMGRSWEWDTLHEWVKRNGGEINNRGMKGSQGINEGLKRKARQEQSCLYHKVAELEKGMKRKGIYKGESTLLGWRRLFLYAHIMFGKASIVCMFVWFKMLLLALSATFSFNLPSKKKKTKQNPKPRRMELFIFSPSTKLSGAGNITSHTTSTARWEDSYWLSPLWDSFPHNFPVQGRVAGWGNTWICFGIPFQCLINQSIWYIFNVNAIHKPGVLPTLQPPAGLNTTKWNSNWCLWFFFTKLSVLFCSSNGGDS